MQAALHPCTRKAPLHHLEKVEGGKEEVVPQALLEGKVRARQTLKTPISCKRPPLCHQGN